MIFFFCLFTFWLRKQNNGTAKHVVLQFLKGTKSLWHKKRLTRDLSKKCRRTKIPVSQSRMRAQNKISFLSTKELFTIFKQWQVGSVEQMEKLYFEYFSNLRMLAQHWSTIWTSDLPTSHNQIQFLHCNCQQCHNNLSRCSHHTYFPDSSDKIGVRIQRDSLEQETKWTG